MKIPAADFEVEKGDVLMSGDRLGFIIVLKIDHENTKSIFLKEIECSLNALGFKIFSDAYSKLEMTIEHKRRLIGRIL